jgi:hypothetical protein
MDGSTKNAALWQVRRSYQLEVHEESPAEVFDDVQVDPADSHDCVLSNSDSSNDSDSSPIL